MPSVMQECFIPLQYRFSPEAIKNCLQEVLSEGNINSQVSAPADNDYMTKKHRDDIIKKHTEQYTTKYYESDRRWHSFLPDENSPRKKKPIAKRKWEDLADEIVAYYEAQEEDTKRKRITLRQFYPEWFTYKWQDTNNSNYMKHIDGEWNRFYADDPIVDRPVVELTALELKNWARNKIISCQMNKKQYYNMAVIIRQSLEYLVELGILPTNHYAEFKIKASLFTPTVPKDAEFEVFNIDDKGVVRLILIYPMNVGRCIPEILRALTALQVADSNKLSTPANWVPCQPGIISPPQTFEALEKRKREIEKNQNGMTWYLSFQNVKDCEKIGQTSCEGNKLE